MKEESGCIVCGGNVGTSQRAGKPHKYCSKKCANKFHHEKDKKKHPRCGDPTWKNKTKLQKQDDQEKNQEKILRFEWLNENWYSYKKLSSITGKETSTCRGIAHTLELERKQITVKIDDRVKTFTFLSPENAEKVINYQPKIGKGEYPPVPDGYLIREGLALHLKYRGMRSISWIPIIGVSKWQQSDKCSKRGLYSVVRAEEIINNELARREAAQQSHAEEKRIKKDAIKKRRQLREAARKEKIARKKGKREERARLYKENNICRVCGNGIDYRLGRWRYTPVYCSDDCRRKTLFLPDNIKKHEIAETEELYGADTKRGIKAIEVNEEYERRKRCGVITKINCKACNVEKAYDDFYRDLTVLRGRQNTCKQCKREKNMEKYDPVLAKDGRRLQNPITRMRALVVGSIKSNIGRYAGRREQLRIPKAWEHIEKRLGYTAEDLVSHIESQFNDKMNWKNWGQYRIGGIYTWQIDHIIPQSYYKYTSLEDPNFAECWKMENLRPLCSIENSKKGANFPE